MTNALISREYRGTLIHQREGDGYFNATAMCKAVGRPWSRYRHDNEPTEAFLKALATEIGIPTTEIIQSLRGGIPELQGTWVHPRVAMHLAQWASPEFAVVVSGWVWDIVSGKPAAPDAMIAALIEATKENAIALRDFGAHLRSQDEQLRDFKRRLDEADAKRDTEIMRTLAEEEFRKDTRVSAVSHLSVYDLLNGTKRSEAAGFFDLRVARKGRGNGVALVRRSLQSYFDQHGHAGDRLPPPQETRHEGALFSIRLIAEWKAAIGGPLIAALQSKEPFARRPEPRGQGVLHLVNPGAKQ